MNDIALRAELNQKYESLFLVQAFIFNSLNHRTFNLRADYLADSMRRMENGGFERCEYPVPTVIVEDVCYISADFDGIWFSARISRRNALQLELEEFPIKDYCIYGSKNSYEIIYSPETTKSLSHSLTESREQWLWFEIQLNSGIKQEELYEFVKAMRRSGFNI